MKSYLNDKEKKMVLFVLVLQVLDNIAMIVLEEMAPGEYSQDHLYHHIYCYRKCYTYINES